MKERLMAKIKLSQYVSDKLSEDGITDVFILTGGGAMHLNDSFGHHPRLKATYFHHEQSCSIAADSYFRLTNKLAVVNVTTGPGGTNAITGVYGAWVDSLGMIVISGQVKRETTISYSGLPIRQIGDQEVDIVRMVSGITKYAVTIQDPQSIKFHLEKALYLAKNGRPGPVWIDIPIDVQGTFIDPDSLPGFNPQEEKIHFNTDLSVVTPEILSRMHDAKRPVMLIGNGVRISNSFDLLNQAITKFQIPVTTAWNAHDLIENSNPFYVGRPGTVGDRAGNFSVQSSDFLLVLGSRLNIRQISYNWKSFAKNAYKVIVDIDELELKKHTVSPDLPVHADLRKFFEKLLREIYTPNQIHLQWLAWCKERQQKYPVVLPEYWDLQEKVNPYCFGEKLFEILDCGDVVVTGDGTACVVLFQTAIIKKNQRLYHNSGSAPMGYDLPGAIGACIANGNKRIICVSGDGSIQLNIQELQTIKGNHLPIKIFILNNNGYLSIKQTQTNYFSGNFAGCDPKSGVTFPDFEKIAYAYDIPYQRIANHKEMSTVIQKSISSDGPQICEVILDLNQGFAPKLASRQLEDGTFVSPDLDDMYPFLPREEINENRFF